MAAVLFVMGVLLIGASAVVGIFLGWDKLPLSITACGFAVAGGLALVGCAIIEAAQIRRGRP